MKVQWPTKERRPNICSTNVLLYSTLNLEGTKTIKLKFITFHITKGWYYTHRGPICFWILLFIPPLLSSPFNVSSTNLTFSLSLSLHRGISSNTSSPCFEVRFPPSLHYIYLRYVSVCVCVCVFFFFFGICFLYQ